MSDIGLTWDEQDGAADVAIAANDLVSDDGLETAIMLSLFTDRQAEPGDVLPDGETDRRGWWGDAVPVVSGDKNGSRLWLLARAKQVPQTLTRAREYSTEALQWLLDDKVSDRVDVASEFVARGVMGIAVDVHRPNLDKVQFRFNYTWASQDARRA